MMDRVELTEQGLTYSDGDIEINGTPLVKRPADLQDHWDKRQQTLSQEEKDSETDYWETYREMAHVEREAEYQRVAAETHKSQPMPLEQIADEVNLIRTDVRAMFDDVRQINFDYMVYDITHRLEALETKLRSEVDA